MQDNQPDPDRIPISGSGGWNRTALLALAGGMLLGLAGLGYGVHLRNEAVRTSESKETALRGEMARVQVEMQRQVNVLQERLAAQETRNQEQVAAVPATPPVPSQPEAQPPKVRPAAPRQAPARRVTTAQPSKPAEDPRFTQLERQLNEQGEKLADTRRMVESARSDLEGRISSTADELHGSIARTSEEVAALRRRGERDYFEFDLTKSKTARRIGPVGLALRKADTKHLRYNLDLMADDNKLEKKNVNLYEPVFINLPEWPQPVELVVNRVEKDRVKGYVSTPKYKRSEIVAAAPDARTRLSPKAGSEESR